MQQRRISVLMESGRAFALLALYVLTLLAPLHQAAATQRDLSAAGYETISQWSICGEARQGSSDDVVPLKCPATGVSKSIIAPPLPAMLHLPQMAEVVIVPTQWLTPSYPARRSPADPRGPPLPGQRAA